MLKKGAYITVQWGSTPLERTDVFKFSNSYHHTEAASYYGREDILYIYINNIWNDTENFEDFVEGLQTVYLTELLCMNYHYSKVNRTRNIAFLKAMDLMCIKTGQYGNECFFLVGAKLALKSDYILTNPRREK